MQADEIKRIVNEIRSKTGIEGDLKRVFFQAKYPKFAHDLPKLFDAALNESFPLNYFELMLNQYECITSQKTSVESANDVVYGKLRGDFVDPLVKVAEEKGESIEPKIIQTGTQEQA